MKDEHLTTLMKSLPEPDTRALNAEIMHLVHRKAARRKMWRVVGSTAAGLVVGCVVLAVLVGVFALLGTIGGMGDWLKAVDEYAVSGLLHLKMLCSSTVFNLAAAVTVTTIVVRVVIAVLESRRAKQNL